MVRLADMELGRSSSPLRRSCFLLVIIVGGLSGGQSTTESSAPSAAAVADIPSDYLALYEQEGARYGIDWAVLAAIGKVECDHGRSQAAGCNPPGTVNEAGATGPMQFIGSTWLAGTPPMSVPAIGPPTTSTSDGYATDGDGDGLANVWDPADAIAGAARLLRANGAPADYPKAIFAYNHDQAYVQRGSFAGERVPRRFRARSVSRDSRRPRLGGRTCRAVHLQPRPADRPWRIGGGHAEQGARRARPATARCSPAGRSRRRASTSG